MDTDTGAETQQRYLHIRTGDMLDCRIRTTCTAFTLIELLIVVAIIAILSAIALPNLMDAQTRAKISRSKSDLRTLAGAIEAYHVDNSRYPPSYLTALDPELLSYLPCLSRLTTPIAYLASVPEDPFANKGGFRDNPWAYEPYQIPFATGQVVHPMTYGYFSAPPGQTIRQLCFGCAGRELNPVLWDLLGSSSPWVLRGVGPSLHMRFGYAMLVYDPTNGTASYGDILYVGGTGFGTQR